MLPHALGHEIGIGGGLGCGGCGGGAGGIKGGGGGGWGGSLMQQLSHSQSNAFSSEQCSTPKCSQSWHVLPRQVRPQGPVGLGASGGSSSSTRLADAFFQSDVDGGGTGNHD